MTKPDFIKVVNDGTKVEVYVPRKHGGYLALTPEEAVTFAEKLIRAVLSIAEAQKVEYERLLGRWKALS